MENEDKSEKLDRKLLVFSREKGGLDFLLDSVGGRDFFSIL